MNDDNCEIQFWKVIRNHVLLKHILYYLTNEISNTPPLKSISYLLDNNLNNHLLHKIINNHEIIFDLNLFDQDNIYKLFYLFSKSNNKLPNYNKHIIKQFYSKLYNIPINNGMKLNEELILSNTINTGNIVPLKQYNKLISKKENRIINCSINKFIELYTPRTYGQPIIIKTLYHLCKHTDRNNNDGNGKSSYDKNIIWDKIIKSIDSIYSFCNLIKSKEKYGQKTDYESSNDLSISTYSINEKYYKSVKPSFSFANYLITTLSFTTITEKLKDQYMVYLHLIFKLCPILHNFKIKFLYGICLSYKLLQSGDSIGIGTDEFKSMIIPKNEINSKLSNFNLNKDKYQSRDNIQLIIKEYNKIKESLHPISRYGDEITALKYGDFNLLKNWYISNQSTQQDKDRLDLIYHDSIIIGQYGKSSFSNIFKYFGISGYINGGIRKQSTNCRLNEILKPNQYTGKIILFKHCPNQDKQIEFINQICDEINNNPNQFKLHPLILLQILIVNDNIELIKIVFNKLSNQLSNIKQCNFNVNTIGNEIEKELSLYDPSLIFQNIKSYQVFHYIFKHGIFSTLNIDWIKIKELYLKGSKCCTITSVTEIDSITELDYSFSKVGLLKSQYLDICITNDWQIEHVKYFILNYKHDKSPVIHYNFDKTIENFYDLDPLKSIQFFDWLNNHFKSSNNQLILSEKNRDIFNYLVFSFNGDIKNLETYFFNTDIVTFDQFYVWPFIKHSIEFSDLTILKLIIKHYFNDSIITTNSNINLNTFIYLLLKKQNSKHILNYLKSHHSFYYDQSNMAKW